MGNSLQVEPTSVAELAEVLRAAGQWRIVGQDSNAGFRLPAAELPVLSTGGLVGIVEFSPRDQVVTVRAGTPLRDLQIALGEHGQCLPMVDWYDGYSPLNLINGTVGGDLSMNLPHELEGECGNWRDWLLAATVVLADGTIAKAGSRAVKNVAGYDVQKLLIGARGTLGVVAEVTLRTTAVRALPWPRVQRHWQRFSTPAATWVQRVKPSDYRSAWENAAPFHAIGFESSSTVWAFTPPEATLPRFEGDWVVRSGCGAQNLQITDPTQIRYMKRAKEIFDPEHKLNPGEMGMF